MGESEVLALKRYDPAHGATNGWDKVPTAIMEEFAGGDYVRFDDVLALLAAKQQEPVGNFGDSAGEQLQQRIERMPLPNYIDKG